jgi:hypothetical protein
LNRFNGAIEDQLEDRLASLNQQSIIAEIHGNL